MAALLPHFEQTVPVSGGWPLIAFNKSHMSLMSPMLPPPNAQVRRTAQRVLCNRWLGPKTWATLVLSLVAPFGHITRRGYFSAPAAAFTAASSIVVLWK